MIAVIMPSRGRPEKSLETFRKWDCNSPYNFQYILSLDIDDPLLNVYMDIYPDFFSLTHTENNCRILVNKNRSAIDAINKAAEYSWADKLIVVSDDSEPCQSWPDYIHMAVSGKRDWILKVQDGIQPWLITQPIMDRTYYDRFGYIYHPDYQHMFCDTELTCVADITGRKITSNILFPHKHYSVTKEKPDAIARKNDSTWNQGEKLFLDRYERNFDLPPGGKIQDNGMINWLKAKHAKV
jgi:hypothetical protein